MDPPTGPDESVSAGAPQPGEPTVTMSASVEPQVTPSVA